MRKKRTKVLAFLLAAVLVLSGSLTSSGPEVQAKGAKVKKLTLSDKKASTYVGGSVKLKVKSVTPKGASAKVKWKSSNKKIATVSSTGVVKGKKAGSVTITAVSKSNAKAAAKCKVTVYAKTTTLKLTSAKTVTLKTGEQATVTAKVTKPKKGAQPVTWSSKNKKVATVTLKGKVTAVSEGTATIVGSSGSKSVKVTVQVNKKADTSEDKSEQGSSQNTFENSGEKKDSGKTADSVATSGDGGKTGGTGSEVSAAYTREEWVSLLVDKMGYRINPEELMQDEFTDEAVYTYADIAQTEYPEKIEAALSHGILPSVVTAENQENIFGVGEPVTREYAAMTAVRAVGYQNESELSCKDDSQLIYPNEDHLAVETGMLSFVDGAFCPEQKLTKAEADQIVSVIDEVLKSREIDSNHEDEVVYNENVLTDITEVTAYQAEIAYDEDERPVNVVKLPYTAEMLQILYEDVAASIQNPVSKNGIAQPVADSDCPAIGRIIVLPQTEAYPFGKMLTIERVTLDAQNDQIILSGAIPNDISDVYESLNIEGVVTTQAGEIQLGEGVTFADNANTEADNEELDAAGGSFLGTKELGWSKDFDIDLAEKELEPDVTASAKATVTLAIKDIEYRLDYTEIPPSVNDVYINVHSSVGFKLSGKVEYSGKKQIAIIPFPLGQTGLLVNVKFYLTTSTSGEISVSYEVDHTFGVQYQGNQLSKIGSASAVLTPSEVEAETKIGASVGVDLTFGETISIYNVRADVGAAINADGKERTNGLVCIDVTPYLYMDLYIGEESDSGGDCILVTILKALTGSKKCILQKDFNIINKDNSPLKYTWHFEDGKRVQNCTYDKQSDNVWYSGTWYGLNWTVNRDGYLLITGTY
ncbi:MAG: Ig domain-containing protein, partial [Lachnospiraceae bacterium]|nr:Ig domain-containing protein [Lachnospiraceae bacterium]